MVVIVRKIYNERKQYRIAIASYCDEMLERDIIIITFNLGIITFKG